MPDLSDLPVPAANLAGGPLPFTAYRWSEIPADLLAHLPEREDVGDGMALCIIHPPVAALMAAVPEAVLSSMVLPGLSAGAEAMLHREVIYVVDGVTTPDGLYLLFIREAK